MPDDPGDSGANPGGGDVLVDPAAEEFYAGAFRRILWMMGVFAPLAVAAGWMRWGSAIALGLAVGCLVAFANFIWLKRIVAAMADRITRPRAAGVVPSARALVARYLLRYLFIAVAAYAIFKSSPSGLYGLLAGLFLPVPAIFCEAAYEVAVSQKRGV